VSIRDITQIDFKSVVLDSNLVTMVEFYADWCVPCKKMLPILEELSIFYNNVVNIFKLNIENSPELTKQFSINSVPLLIFFKDGKEISRKVGLNSKKNIENCIEEIKNVSKTQ
jgi:thioredoxin 1